MGKQETAEQAVIRIVEDLVQDWDLSLKEDVGGGTMLVKDLTFASVDIIQLAVALEEHYGRKLGFQDLLMVDGSYVGDLSIVQIANFVEAKLKRAAA
jgi:acyl carrier protein